MPTDESVETAAPQSEPVAKPAAETPQPPKGENGKGAAAESAAPGSEDLSEKVKKQIGYELRKALKGLSEAEEDFREAGIDIRNRTQVKQVLAALANKDTVVTESEQRLRALEKRTKEAEEAARRAQERADSGDLEAFALKNMGEVFNRGVALAALGLSHVPKERLAKREGRIIVVDDQDIETHHDPAEWIQKRLDSKELDFLRPGRGLGLVKPPPAQAGRQPEAPRQYRDVNERKRAAIEAAQKEFGKS